MSSAQLEMGSIPEIVRVATLYLAGEKFANTCGAINPPQIRGCFATGTVT